MRRRTSTSNSLPERFQPEALPEWRDDFNQHIDDRIRSFQQWWQTREEWTHARRAWIDRNQPNRADYYASIEPPVPDEPFDQTQI